MTATTSAVGHYGPFIPMKEERRQKTRRGAGTERRTVTKEYMSREDKVQGRRQEQRGFDLRKCKMDFTSQDAHEGRGHTLSSDCASFRDETTAHEENRHRRWRFLKVPLDWRVVMVALLLYYRRYSCC
ncbi:uncharacterized protein LOC121892073 isoform X3 [Thunnus maccoyii]|uniref:uncharacterized protein LOC121892073 isoform X3 n=1 Tax=Thunnus maccoyii TaxID=8240 RepID=UPI001C4C4795|nr:uncharacterized protein LOC121892073 isoform X3 [Thunnus maccoyii]